MNLTNIISAITTSTAYGDRVAVASNMIAAIEATKPFKSMPVCVIFGLDETARPNELATGGPRHRVAISIKLMTACRDVTDPHGKAAYAQAETARALLLPALLGVVPDTAYAPLEYQSGRLVYAEAGTLLWLDEFITAYYLSPA